MCTPDLTKLKALSSYLHFVFSGFPFLLCLKLFSYNIQIKAKQNGNYKILLLFALTL